MAWNSKYNIFVGENEKKKKKTGIFISVYNLKRIYVDVLI